MCRPASMIVTRTSVLIGSSDSHTTIAEEHKIPDARIGREVPAVPIEIYPDDGDFRRPPSEWRLHTDLPRKDWHVAQLLRVHRAQSQ